MSRRERIAQKLVRLAEVREQVSMVAVARAEEARDEAAAEVAALDAAQERAEAQLTGHGVLSGLDRELLWIHRSRARIERQTTEERLALTDAQVAGARAELTTQKKHLAVRERVFDHVHAEMAMERMKKEQGELDELVTLRWRFTAANAC